MTSATVLAVATALILVESQSAARRDLAVALSCDWQEARSHPANAPFECRAVVRNKGPQTLPARAGLTVALTKIDPSTQQPLKTVDVKDIPAIQAGDSVSIPFRDSSGPGAFLYRAGIKASGHYYSDSDNVNNADSKAVVFER